MTKTTLLSILFLIAYLGISAPHCYGADNILKSFFVIDKAKNSDLDFALLFAKKLFQTPQVDIENSAVEIVFVGKALSFLEAKGSPAKKRYQSCLKKGWNLKLIGCGKSIKKMRQDMDTGKLTLLPGVQLIDNVSEYRKKKQKNNWYEIKIPPDN